jgi:hypothetical protein
VGASIENQIVIGPVGGVWTASSRLGGFKRDLALTARGLHLPFDRPPIHHLPAK